LTTAALKDLASAHQNKQLLVEDKKVRDKLSKTGLPK